MERKEEFYKYGESLGIKINDLQRLKILSKENLVDNKHYNNDNGSLYLFAEQHNLNAWEFEIIKRVVRCRKKGEFLSDLEKTKVVIDLYLKEQGHLYDGEREILNKK